MRKPLHEQIREFNEGVLYACEQTSYALICLFVILLIVISHG